MLLEEMETTVTFNKADDCWMVYSSIPKDIRFFDKIVTNNPDTCKVIRIERVANGAAVTKQYKISKDKLAFRVPCKRNMTEEQRSAAAERLSQYHKQKNHHSIRAW